MIPLRNKLLKVMSDGNWHSTDALSKQLETSISTLTSRIRELRLPEFGEYRIKTRRKSGNIFEYQMCNPPSCTGSHTYSYGGAGGSITIYGGYGNSGSGSGGSVILQGGSGGGSSSGGSITISGGHSYQDGGSIVFSTYVPFEQKEAIPRMWVGRDGQVSMTRDTDIYTSPIFSRI